MLDIIGKRFWFFLTSGIIILICIISLATLGLKPGIDFSSGSMMTLSFEQEVTANELRQELTDLGYGNAIVQRTGEGNLIVRTIELTATDKSQLKENLTTKEQWLVCDFN